MRFSDEDIKNKLKKFFGFDSFRDTQKDIIHNLLDGNDSFVLMPTGGGKSLCYQLPALLMDGTAIVISPLISLMKNQVDAIRGFEASDTKIAHFLNSSLKKTEADDVKADVLGGRTKLLYVAPETLTKFDNVEFLREIRISFYAIDEAHCISEWGHDFRPEYRRIREIVDRIGPAPIIALTATATPKVQLDILKNLSISDARVFKSSFNRPNLYYEVREKSDIKRELLRFIKSHSGQSGIIYCLSRKKVEEVAEFLCTNGVKALPYHAGLDSKVRAENQDAFLMEEVDVIVATIAFGMGIDKPNVRFVIHYNMPKSLEGYYQETGRAGRDGELSWCIAFYSEKDKDKLDKFMQSKPLAEQEIGRQLLQETSTYAESSQCRRKLLLNYFGESYGRDNCCNCDNCLHPVPRYDGTEDMALVIELILSLPELFRTEHLAMILSGEENAMIQSYRHDKTEFFGKGGRTSRHWISIIRQGALLGLLHKGIEDYGLISVTGEGRAFLDRKEKLMLKEDREFKADDDEEDQGSIREGGGDQTLLAMLKDLRRDLSRRLKIQPWVIFSDPSLDDMSIFYPVTQEELKKCQGVGEGKAAKFGAEFIKLIDKYVRENDVDRPDDFIIKSPPSKSPDKVTIIQQIDRQINLEDIARNMGMDMDRLLSEMESIVYSGLKINLDYYVEECFDPSVVEELSDYFRSAETDNLRDARKILGDDYEDVELRVMRMKYLCDNGA